ncbi:two-component sensor histidine kinase [Campylobacter blaseri]|uniref:histidine kinase n=1 Tax=Campylobacter blaseri TaxID=2042961 RepID=A0A2P8QYM2_9BACT|nr:two-component sensor histidine kinase [Campylobacter blaseri]PSM52488.1 two-component sensor histidine kinase [Campylobacter blaseri]
MIIYFMYLSIVKPHLEQKKMMNIFFNDAMHELKTPLGVASINLEMLDVKTKHTHRIKSALKQMKITYEDVEYYIKNRQVDFPKINLNLSNFLKDRIKFLSTIAHSKNMEIISNIEDSLCIYMSEIEATRLIDNNISNAIKYSDVSSKIIVTLKKDRGYAVFTIKDFGKGIKDPKNIWNRYTREDVSLGGFGLGLNIVLNICLKYNISYKVDSDYGKGSTFVYKIPLYTDKFLDKVI